MWQEKLDKAQRFIEQDGYTTKRAFTRWWFITYRTSAEGRALTKRVKTYLDELCNSRGFPEDFANRRSSYPEEVVKVFQIWEDIPLVEGSAEWKTARMRMFRDIIFDGHYQEYQDKGLRATSIELASTRCWFLKRADGTIAKYPSLNLPWCFKDLVWDLATESHKMVLRHASTSTDPNTVALVDMSNILVGLQSWRIDKDEFEHTVAGHHQAPTVQAQQRMSHRYDPLEWDEPEEDEEVSVWRDPRAAAVMLEGDPDEPEYLTGDHVHDWFMKSSQPSQKVIDDIIRRNHLPDPPAESSSDQPIFKPGGGINWVGESTAGSDTTEKPYSPTPTVKGPDEEAEVRKSPWWETSSLAPTSKKERESSDQEQPAEKEEPPQKRMKTHAGFVWTATSATSVNEEAPKSRASQVLAMHDPTFAQSSTPPTDPRTRRFLRAVGSMPAPAPKKEEEPEPMEE
ncbi:MAG: hypothetical protein Q9183_003421 [Haloplaca sp. 2 TL-2023]